MLAYVSQQFAPFCQSKDLRMANQTARWTRIWEAGGDGGRPFTSNAGATIQLFIAREIKDDFDKQLVSLEG